VLASLAQLALLASRASRACRGVACAAGSRLAAAHGLGLWAPGPPGWLQLRARIPGDSVSRTPSLERLYQLGAAPSGCFAGGAISLDWLSYQGAITGGP